MSLRIALIFMPHCLRHRRCNSTRCGSWHVFTVAVVLCVRPVPVHAQFSVSGFPFLNTQVKPKPARTAVEVRAEAVEQILAAQRATSPIREHIERRRRAQVHDS